MVKIWPSLLTKLVQIKGKPLIILTQNFTNQLTGLREPFRRSFKL